MRNTISKFYNAVSAPVAATRDALAARLQSIRETASVLYNRMMDNTEYGRERLKDIVEKEAREDEEETTEQTREEEEDNIDLTPQEHERALKEAYKSLVIPGTPKTDTDSYFDQIKPHIKALIEDQLNEMQSAKVTKTLWVRWKKPVKLPITLDPKDVEGAQDIGDNTGDNYIKVKMPFNNLMIKIFEVSDIDGLIQRMFAHIKTQVENPRMPESGCTLDQIMHLHINFHKLALTRGSSYIKLPEWIASKKVVINPKNNDEVCFKWAVIVALHHEEIAQDPQRILNLQHYEHQYSWNGLEFPLETQKIGKFERNNPGIAVNVLSNKKGSIYTAHKSELNGKCSKQVNLLMIVDGENRHYTAIKNISRLLSKLNGKSNRAYHYCINCLNHWFLMVFGQCQQEISTMSTVTAMLTSRLRCLL